MKQLQRIWVNGSQDSTKGWEINGTKLNACSHHATPDYKNGVGLNPPSSEFMRNVLLFNLQWPEIPYPMFWNNTKMKTVSRNDHKFADQCYFHLRYPCCVVSVLPHAISYVYTWDMSRSSTQFRWFGCWNVKVLQKQLSQIVYWKHDDLQIFSLYVCLAIYIICPITLPLIHNLEWFKCKSLVYSSILCRPSTHTIILSIPCMNSVHYHKVIYLTKTRLSSNGAVYVDSNIERWWTQKYTMNKLTYYPIEVEWPIYAYLNRTIIGSGNGL